MDTEQPIINPIHPSVIDKCDPEFVKAYNRDQGPRPAAHQVPYEVYNQDRPKYSMPAPDPEHPIAEPAVTITHHLIKVTTPPGEIQIQMIRPNATDPDTDLLPAYIDFHGGGFVIGDLTTDLAFCTNVAQHVGCAVFNIAYRLAPAFPHPTPATDSFDALKWIVAHASELHIDASRLAVGGFSAGGCLAAALAIMARDDGGIPPLRLQLLIVPIVDCRYVPEEGGADPATVPYKSYVQLEHAPCLPLARLVWFYNLWLGKGSVRAENAKDFRASPIVAADHSGLPPASIHCAQLDPLVDEGRAYFEKLAPLDPTKTTSITVYPGVGHPFMRWTRELPVAREFHQNACKALREALK